MGITEQTENEMNAEAAKEHIAGTGQKTVGQAAEAASDSMRQAYAFAADVKLKECKYCRVMIPEKARICPNCKSKLRKHILGKTVAAVLVIAVIGAGGYGLSAYLGWLPDSVVPVWLARQKPVEAVEATTAVEAAETAAGAKTVEPVDLLQPETAETQQGMTGQTVRPEAAEVPQGMADQAARPEMERASQAAEQNVRPETAEQPGDGTGLTAAEDTAADGLAKAVKDTENAMARAGEIDGSGTAKQDGNGKTAAGNVTLKDGGTAPDDRAEADAEEGQDDKTAMADEDSGQLNGDGVAAGDDDTEMGGGTAVNREDMVEETAKRSQDKSAEKTGKAAGNDEEPLDEEMDENEAAFRADCVRRGYKELLRNEDYLGTAVWLEAEVICQVDGGLFDENIYYLCVENENNIRRYYIIRDDRAADETLILEGDMLTVYGRLFGNCKLPASLVETRPTVPAISMLCCDLAEE